MNPPEDAVISIEALNSKMVSLLLEILVEQRLSNEYLIRVAIDLRHTEMSEEERLAKFDDVITKLTDYKAKMKIDLYETIFLNKPIDDSENQDQ